MSSSRDFRGRNPRNQGGCNNSSPRSGSGSSSSHRHRSSFDRENDYATAGIITAPSGRWDDNNVGATAATRRDTYINDDDTTWSPSSPPSRTSPRAGTTVVDMLNKYENMQRLESHDDDEAMARKLQDDINAEFGGASPNRKHPPVSYRMATSASARPAAAAAAGRSSQHQQHHSTQYEIAPVDNKHMPYAKRTNHSSSRQGQYNTESYMQKYREQDEYNEYHQKATRGGGGAAAPAGNRSQRDGRSQHRQGGYGHHQDTYVDESEELSRKLARQLQDEEVARQLQAQQEEEERRRRRRAAREEARLAAVSTAAAAASGSRAAREEARRAATAASAPKTGIEIDSRSRTASTTISHSSSDEAARKIAQEMDDEDFAQRLAAYEREVAQQQADQRAPNRRNGLLFYRLVPLFCVVVAIVVSLLFVFGVFTVDKVKKGLGNVFDGDNDWVDPFKGDVNINGAGGGPTGIPEGQMAWPVEGPGLSLTLLNAMEDKWDNLVEVAVQNWDEGYPIDSLTLSVTPIAYEATCEAVVRAIKLCNADYGATQWRGLNDISFNARTKEIVKSSAKMNEFYLAQETDEQRLYTLCHEIGHGFGLPHWDENFQNQDLGNCMDYTYV